MFDYVLDIFQWQPLILTAWHELAFVNMSVFNTYSWTGQVTTYIDGRWALQTLGNLYIPVTR